MMHIKHFFGTLLDLVYPRRCPVCDGAVKPFGSLICQACEHQFVYIKDAYCLKCGKSLQEQEREYCTDCMRHRHFFDSGRALFEYQSISGSIYRFKYKGRQEYGAYYAKCMADELGDWLKSKNPDALVPVPIHHSKRLVRGYNQAEILAKELGRLTGLPVETKLITRARKTVPMKELSPSERQNNLKRAFKISRNDVKLNTIVIIDDIYTTGSTIDAMSCEFRRMGVKHIYFMTLSIGRGL
jgi:ComF family protein